MMRFYVKCLLFAFAVGLLQAGALYVDVQTGPEFDRFPLIGAPNSTVNSDPNVINLGGERNPSIQATTNSYGARGRERTESDQWIVVAVGNSTTLCSQLDDTTTWPQQLEDQLNELSGGGVWVLNAGIAGATTRHYPLVCEYVLPAVGGVDVALIVPSPFDLDLFLQHKDGPLRFGDANWAEDAAAVRAAERHVFWGGGRTPERNSYVRSLEGLLLRWMPEEGTAAPSPAARPLLRRGGITQAALANTVVKRRTIRQRVPPIAEPAPDFSPLVAEVRSNLERAIRACKKAGIQPILVTCPALWQDEMGATELTLVHYGIRGNWMSDDAEWYPVSVLLEGYKAFNGAVRSTGRSLDIPVIDLENSVPRTAEYFTDDIHFTERGAGRFASALAPALRAQLETLQGAAETGP